MVVTILKSSAHFNAVRYNEKKVSNGSAYVLDMQNINYLQGEEGYTTEELVDFFELYTKRNDRVTKGQFHVSFSVKGDEMSHDEILDYAKLWLKEMGYGEEGQPVIAYAHHDTENNHVHIITSRVRPDGKKVDHAHEALRSQKVMEKLEGKRMDYVMEKDIRKALSFSFDKVVQLSAIFQAMGYKTFRDKNDKFLSVKKGAAKWKQIQMDQIKQSFKTANLSPEELKQIRATIFQYRDMSSDKNMLSDFLHKNFGYKLHFMGPKDKPFGYYLVDFANKRVLKGSQLISLKNLLDFRTKEEHLETVDGLIDRMIDANPEMTTKDLRAQLKRYRISLRQGKIYFKGASRDLHDYVAELLDINDKVAWINSFKPSSDFERKLLCKFAKIKPEYIPLVRSKQGFSDAKLQEFSSCLSNDREETYANLKNLGYSFFMDENRYVIMNSSSHEIETLNPKDFRHAALISQLDDVRREWMIKEFPQRERIRLSNATHIEKPAVGIAQNREWEICDTLDMDELEAGWGGGRKM